MEHYIRFTNCKTRCVAYIELQVPEDARKIGGDALHNIYDVRPTTILDPFGYVAVLKYRDFDKKKTFKQLIEMMTCIVCERDFNRVSGEINNAFERDWITWKDHKLLFDLLGKIELD